MILEVPDGFIFQLWSKERVELGQNCNQPTKRMMGGGKATKESGELMLEQYHFQLG